MLGSFGCGKAKQLGSLPFLIKYCNFRHVKVCQAAQLSKIAQHGRNQAEALMSKSPKSHDMFTSLPMCLAIATFTNTEKIWEAQPSVMRRYVKESKVLFKVAGYADAVQARADSKRGQQQSSLHEAQRASGEADRQTDRLLASQ